MKLKIQLIKLKKLWKELNYKRKIMKKLIIFLLFLTMFLQGCLIVFDPYYGYGGYYYYGHHRIGPPTPLPIHPYYR